MEVWPCSFSLDLCTVMVGLGVVERGGNGIASLGQQLIN